MFPPLMIDSLVFLPKSISMLAIIVLIFTGIVEFRQGHIGRVGIFANAFLLWQIFYSSWQILPNWFQLYLDVGTAVGIVALLAYLAKEKLPTEFYQISFILYGSFSVILAIFVGLNGVSLF